MRKEILISDEKRYLEILYDDDQISHIYNHYLSYNEDSIRFPNKNIYFSYILYL